MKLPHWRTIRAMHNAARDRRQARCIDTTSDAGAWAFELEHGAHSIRVSDYDTPARKIPLRPDPDYRTRRLAQFTPERRAKYWANVRAINAGAV